MGPNSLWVGGALPRGPFPPAEEDSVLASFILQDEFDKFKDKIAADKIELVTVIKTSTSSLQAEMLSTAQSFKGIMA